MLEHGVPFRLNSRVRRLVAPNPGVMTGPGTNTYLLGDDEVAVLDPGPAMPAHIDAILDTARRSHPLDRLHPHAPGSLARLAGGGRGHRRAGDRRVAAG